MYIIGDVHGCARSLERLLEKIPDDRQLFSTGDLIDRGPDSRKVVSLCVERGIRAVMGNHEHMLLDYIDGAPYYGSGTYLMNGGDRTLNAYEGGLSIRHMEYLSALPLYIETEHFFLSHAGIHFLRTVEDACDFSLDMQHNILWNRAALADLGKPQVVGHNMKRNVSREMKDDRVISINIDTGCCNPDFGVLSAISFPEGEVISVDCSD